MGFYGLQNLQLFFRALISLLFSFKNYNYNCLPRKIVIIQLAKMGDMVCTTPMFRAIKNKYPSCRIIVVGNKINGEILNDNGDVDSYVEFGGNIVETAKILKNEFIDAGFINTPSFTALAILILANVRKVVTPRVINGFCPQQTILYRILSVFTQKINYSFGQYIPGLYLKLLEPIGIISNDTTKHLGFSASAKDKINKFLVDHNAIKGRDLLIGIAPSAGNKIKIWSADNFAKIADHLFNKYRAKLFLFGGPLDKDEIAKTISSLNHSTQIVTCAELFSIDELKAMISNLSLFVSTDTGPIYIAEAFGIPTVDIVGPMDEREQPPIGSFNKIVKIMRDKPVIHILNARIYDKNEARRQIDEISSEMVISEVDNLMELINNRAKHDLP